MSILANIGGAWKTASGIWVNVGGVWRPASQMYAKVGGVWKIVFESWFEGAYPNCRWCVDPYQESSQLTQIHWDNTLIWEDYPTGDEVTVGGYIYKQGAYMGGSYPYNYKVSRKPA